MGAPADSEPSMASSELAAAGPAGLSPGQRAVVAGRYRLLEHIADGGMGSVFVAEHTLSRKKLALKVVHPYLCKGRQGVERFRREVSAAAEIDHPGIVQVYDAGVDDDGGFFMAMELLEGESLGDLLRRQWPGQATAVGMIEGILEPLAKAHAKGFIHRDLKPDNIFIAIDEAGRERVKLLDFGLAREVTKGGPTRTGITFGTPEYMSPEQAMSARKVRAPGDVWSIGVMLYELLSGDHPFQGETPNAIMANAIKEPLPPLRDLAPHVPPPLAALIERCLEKEPSDRPQTAGEMLEELRAVLASVTLDETVPAAPNAPQSWNESDSDVLISSDFPIAPARRSQARLATEIVGEDTDSERAALPTSTRRVFLVLGAVLVLAIMGSGALLFLSPDDAPPAQRAAQAGAEEAQPTPPPPPPEVDAVPEPARVEAREVSPSEVEPSEVAEVVAPAEPEAPPERATARASAPSAPPSARRRPDGPSPMEEARACIARGDQNCAREALAGRARTAEEQALLINLYWTSGRMNQALPLMRRFVRRWPTHGETPGYRSRLASAGG